MRPTKRAGSVSDFIKSETELAAAKVNLTLRIVGRRADGYHELESLVAFAPFGDRLTLRGCGVPALRGEGRGDQIVHIVVKTPTHLTERQEELLRELAAIEGEHTKGKKRWPWSK